MQKKALFGLPIMKIWIIAALILALTGTAAQSRGLTTKMEAKEYQVEVETDRNPLVVGDNRLEIVIRDSSGKIVTDAKVAVNYYMPPMPRMVPMNYKTEADLKGGKYRATMQIIMAGPWYIRIIITHGGRTVTTKFNVDAQ
jgi:hypothetical protein